MDPLHNERAQIRKHFDFLFQMGYNFKEYDDLRGSSSWVILLESDVIKAMITHDRGEIDLRLAPAWKRKTYDNRHYVDLETLIAFMQKDVSYQCFKNSAYDTDEQMKILSKILSKNYAEIVDLFEKSTFTRVQNDLAMFLEQRREHFLGKYGYRSKLNKQDR